jgi:pimeloyl-ACP methyl ester carboxylesterase
MKTSLISVLILQLLSINLAADLQIYYKDFMESHGYKLEENLAITDDGFILNVWHLNPKVPNGKVAFLQHGLSDTAWCFFQLGSKSLPFLLLKEGYDVWLGNIRGNIFSNKHVSKDPTNAKSGYSDYSIDEFVQFDLPAMIKFVKSKTGGKKMSYIGHSQGTTIFFMLVMSNPSLAEASFDHFVTLGTVPNIAHTDFVPIELLDKIYGILRAVGIFNAFSLTNTQRDLISSFCKTAYGICGKAFDLGASIKPSGRIDYKKIFNFLYYYPGGVSKNNLLHWSQIHTMKKLVYFNPNFEKDKTAEAYNTNNLKKWKIKALIARTNDDTFSSYQDVTDFYSMVENKQIVKILDLVNYGHLDCLAADSAVNDIFTPIINFLKK